jgi:putative PIN family toxin of toxin-antitoxin system
VRVVLDTNVLVSALLSPKGSPARIYAAWIEGRFTLLTSSEQLAELKATLAKPKLRRFVHRAQTGRLINELGVFAEIVSELTAVRRSPDPDDDFLLELAEGGQADYLVTGDQGDLLLLARHGRTRIVGARFFCERVLTRQRGR